MTTDETMNHASLAKLAQAWKDRDETARKAKGSLRAAQDLEREILATVVPDAVSNSMFIALTKTTALVVHRLEMSPALTPNRLPYWTARGIKVRFRVGNRETIGPGHVEQPYYETLPEDIRALTHESMMDASRAQKLTGIEAPLKITERQGSMLSMLATNSERLEFSPQPVDGGQKLPSAIWDSASATQSIWTAMVKRGVLEIVEGDLSDRWSFWKVNPGPRFFEAVVIVGKQLRDEYPNSTAAENFQAVFGAPKAPVRRQSKP